MNDFTIDSIEQTFERSRWFQRGWTLQELIAPGDVIFYDRDWNELGTKRERCAWVSQITGIDEDILLNLRRLNSCSIAQRMSWASTRETTREEDIAYSLMGIFEVHMPLLYGEGDKAFIRLQEEIIKRHQDDSILAWALNTTDSDILEFSSDQFDINFDNETSFSINVLANSPRGFRDSGQVLKSNRTSMLTAPYAPTDESPLTLTNVGLGICLPLALVYHSGKPHDPNVNGYIGILSCTMLTSSQLLGVFLLHRKGQKNFHAC
jgi:hypothetical protein